ncbi:biotin-dependent carboxyltransferase family protein [uncultured Caballeronia sp.]|uniref:5-oxoprolinase subunit C family protein n=1 Tax=uncultured Caballeronia sp. TaxID=1827198 RepID=UPI0035CB31CF
MIELLKVAPLCSVQDVGRFGFRHVGVGTSGAMDTLALRVGNILVGNAEGSASIEITVFPFVARFTVAMRVAVTGGGCSAEVEGKRYPPWWSFSVKAGETLTISPPARGARAYLSVSGGLDVPVVLGSRSTDLKMALGGFQGRCLKRGDVLSINDRTDAAAAGVADSFGVSPPQCNLGANEGAPQDSHGGQGQLARVRVVAGPEYDSFSEEATMRLWEVNWQVSPTSNRIGYRLEGPEMHLQQPLQMLSHGIVPGVVQVPPNGKPIVMMSDAQTSGGYPKIGAVIEADLWRLAQLPVGGSVRFHRVSIEEGILAEKLQAKYVETIRASQWRGVWI